MGPCALRLAACGAALALLLGYVLQDVNRHLGEKQLRFNDGQCQLLAAELLKGGEDLALWRGGAAVVAAGDLKTTFSRGPEHARLTGAFAVDLRVPAAGTPRVRRLALEGFPAGPPLVGHGLFLSNRTQRLYVVNHGDVASRVEVFELLGEGFEDLRLRHVDRIESDLFPYHCINDVVEGSSADEVFVSVWRHTVGVEAYNQRQDMADAFDFLTYRYVSQRLGDLGVLRCARADGRWACARTGAWGLPSANGLAIAPDRGTLLVSCPPCMEVWRYRVGPDGSLTEEGPRIPLPYPADNLEWDEETGRIFLGMIPIPTRAYPGVSPMELMALRAGSLHEAPRSLLLHDGGKLSQCSAGLQYGEALLLGSPYHAGLLYCSRAA